MRRYLPLLIAMLLMAGCARRETQSPVAVPAGGAAPAPVAVTPSDGTEPPTAAIEITGPLGRNDPSTLTMDELAEGMRTFVTDRPLERLKVLYDRWYPTGWRPAVLEADLNGDGAAEVITAPRVWGEKRPMTGAGTLIVINQTDGGWTAERLPGEEVQGIFLYEVADLAGDRLPEIVWGSAMSGAHTAHHKVFVSQWTPGAFTTLPGRMEMASMQLEVTGHDLVLHGGMIGSVGAGPQRAWTDRYRWTGAEFALIDRRYDQGDWGYWRLVDGVTHERFGRLTDAEKAYRDVLDPQRVVAPPDAVDERGAGNFAEAVRAAARLRLTAMLLGQNGRAPEAAVLVEGATGPYADLLRATLPASSGDEACRLGAAWAAEHPVFIEALNGLFGYANKIWTSENLCGMP
ncbi:MAG TPA: hypothetical protein VD973_00595 [Symbiobacteriaceae bacterium]|jgi:hypothetical protein|nr:hypothetical protein [Symbiobacteriaceae bacterium]